MEKHTQTFNLPQPPSANRYWGKTRQGRYFITTEGQLYRAHVGKRLMLDGYRPLGSARIGLAIVYFPPRRGGLDLDNLNKALWDALEAARLFDNDKQIDWFSARRGERCEQGLVRVRVWPDPDPCPERP